MALSRFVRICIIVLACACANDGITQVAQTAAYYVPMPDQTLLAVDVHLPGDHSEGTRYPALFELTRYWRASENARNGKRNPSLNRLDRFFLTNGYAVVKVDVRGSGASFGTRPVEYGPQEVRDGYALVDWVVNQSWSDGQVGAYGTSYSGTTAELLAASGHPAVKAVVPGWSDFEIYRSPARPYGLIASFIDEWGRLVGAMDRNDAEMLGAHVRRVDSDPDGAMRDQAVADHKANPDVYATVYNAQFWDDTLAAGLTYGELGPQYWQEQIEASRIPMLVLVSWLDAGTIEGALYRFNHFDNPQNLVILASSHGGGGHASPYKVAGTRVAAIPSLQEQASMRLAFFDHYLKGADNGVSGWPPLQYYNMGEERFREGEKWPPGQTEKRVLYLGERQSLSLHRPDQNGHNNYKVDFSVTTGANNRWQTQLGRQVLNLHNRNEADRRMLTFTSEPLQNDLQITGVVTVALNIASDREDGTLLVYLEDVDEGGQSRYLTEGGIRLMHRKTSAISGPFDAPVYSYRREDVMPVELGKVVEVKLKMWATSVLLRQGHRLRIAIAGADYGTLDRWPEEGDVNLTVHWGMEAPSQVTIPVLVE